MIGTFCPKQSEVWIRSFESAPTCFGRWMVVRMGVQMNTGIALMTSIFASVRTFFGSRRAARQDRLTNIGTGPSNLNHTDRRSQHISQTRMENDGRAGDDWTTALASDAFCFQLTSPPYIRSPTTLANSPVPLQTLVRDRVLGIGRSDHSELSSMHECHLAVARRLKGDL